MNTLTPLSDSMLAVLEKKIERGELDVPLLPKIAGQVVRLCEDPDSDAQQLSQLIQSDQSLAGHVMRIANSATYSPNSNLVSLQQAITRLGINLIAEIALSATLTSKMFRTPGYETHIAQVWRHALATALWSKELARSGRRNVEAAFMCGLLHSIGRPVIIQNTLDLAEQEGHQISSDEVLILEEKLQRKASVSVLQHWKMPVVVVECVEYLDHYEDAPNAREAAMIVQGGSSFASHMLHPEALSATALADEPVLADLNFYPDEVETLLNKREAVLTTLEVMAT